MFLSTVGKNTLVAFLVAATSLLASSSDAWMPRPAGTVQVNYGGSLYKASSSSSAALSSAGSLSSSTTSLAMGGIRYKDQYYPEDIPFAEIIGGGRIGSLLAVAGNAIIRGRGDMIDPNKEGPIIVATRNDALNEIIDNCPEHRKADLVFIQNGYLEDFLNKKGLLDNTQVLLYLSVTEKGEGAIDGITYANPEGLTVATGKYAKEFKGRLAALQLTCRLVSPDEYRPAMFEKLIWMSTYMLVGTARQCATVGDTAKEHGTFIQQVIEELMQAVHRKEGVVFPPGTVDRLTAYTYVVADFPCGLKEFDWRNRYFYDMGDGVCPIHNHLMRECAERGLISFALPSTAAKEYD